MPRPPSETLTPREAQLMEILWSRGSATAEEIRADLPDDPHDSTVRTILRVLETKGYVRHSSRGKTYHYRPAIKRERAERSAVRSLLERFFGGSAEALVQRLIEDEQLTPDEFDQIRRMIDQAEQRSEPQP